MKYFISPPHDTKWVNLNSNPKVTVSNTWWTTSVFIQIQIYFAIFCTSTHTPPTHSLQDCLWLTSRIVFFFQLSITHIQFSSVAQSCLNLCDPMDCSTQGFPVRHQLPELIQTYVHPVGDAIQPSHPLSSPSPPTFNPSQHQVLFKWVSSSHQVAKILEFSYSISPSNEYSGLISFRMDWLDLLAVQGTLKSLFQHHSSKASILRRSAFLIVQLSHPCMTTGKTISLTRWIFVGKVMSLLFNMLSTLVIAFLPRNNRLLISWLQSPSAVIWSPKT